MHKNQSNSIWLSNERIFPEVFVIRIIYKIVRNLSNWKLIENFSKFFILPRSSDEKRPVSLRNIGLNCYLNSAFQSIVACTHFVEEMKALERHYPSCNNLIVFNKILYSLSDNSSDDVELSTNRILRNWNKSGEQDTFELLSYVVFQVFNELKKLQQNNLPIVERTNENWIKEKLPLKILIEFRMKCNCGYNFSPTLQSDLALHLPVPFRIYSDKNPFTIEDLLDNYFVPENILDFPCLNEKCTNAHVTKFIILQKPMPNTFCLHIQRSFWNTENKRMEKNNEKISFRERLIVKSEYFSEIRTCRDGPISIACREICETENLFSTETEFCSKNETKYFNGDVKEKEDERCKIEVDVETHNLTKGDLVEVNDDSEILLKEKMRENKESLRSKLTSTTSIESQFLDEESQNIKEYVNQISVDTKCNGNPIDHESTQKSSISLSDNKSSTPNKVPISTLNFSENQTLSSIVNGIAQSVDVIIDEVNQHHKNHLDNQTFENEEYFLKSVIVHFGRAESGHYICYRKCGMKWFCTNDNFITEVPFREVQNSQAYILMYEKAD